MRVVAYLRVTTDCGLFYRGEGPYTLTAFEDSDCKLPRRYEINDWFSGLFRELSDLMDI